MPSSMDTFDAALKNRHYDKKDFVEQLRYGKRTLLGLLRKSGDTGMVGRQTPVPIIYGNPQGVGSTFATAQAAATNILPEEFNVKAGKYYGVVEIGDMVMKASRTNAGAFLSNKMAEIDGLNEQMAESLSIHLWGNGGGALGRIAAINTNTITLTTTGEASNFEPGMTVVAGANDGSDEAHTLRVGSTTIVSVNPGANVIVVDDATDITSLTQGDYLFRASDFGGANSELPIRGIQCYVWHNDSPPTLWGVSNTLRAAYPHLLAGCRLPASVLNGRGMEERIRLLGAYMTSVFKSDEFDAGFLNPLDWVALETSLQSKGVSSMKDESTKFGYRKIDWGGVPIYKDRHVPVGHFFGLTLKHLWLSSLDEFIHVQNGDGLTMLRKANSTDYEYRLISYPGLCCNKPLALGRVPIA